MPAPAKVSTLNGVLKHRNDPKPPVWGGPEEDGVTQSLLNKFLTCRERFRLYVVEGLRAKEKWRHATGYGNLWHACEEAHAKGSDYLHLLHVQARRDKDQWPLQQDEINKWTDICGVQFPIYVRHWSKHPDMKGREPICQELAFNVAHPLPSGRVVKLRGKWDSVDLAGKGRERGVWVQENKSKGDPDFEAIKRQCSYDLQSMLYLVALRHCQEDLDGPMQQFMGPIKGIRYNVVRRPLSGGKHTISQLKEKRRKPRIGKKGNVLDPGKVIPAETWPDFMERLGKRIEGDAGFFFQRFHVPVSNAEVDRFCRETLDPILEGLCQWWDHVEFHNGRGTSPFDGHHHWRHPFGCDNMINEGYDSDVDSFLETGSRAGLQKVSTVFPELEGAK